MSYDLHALWDEEPAPRPAPERRIRRDRNTPITRTTAEQALERYRHAVRRELRLRRYSRLLRRWATPWCVACTLHFLLALLTWWHALRTMQGGLGR